MKAFKEYLAEGKNDIINLVDANFKEKYPDGLFSSKMVSTSPPYLEIKSKQTKDQKAFDVTHLYMIDGGFEVREVGGKVLFKGNKPKTVKFLDK